MANVAIGAAALRVRALGVRRAVIGSGRAIRATALASLLGAGAMLLHHRAAAEACGDDFTPIFRVQGSGPASPLVGAEVAVEGVVVGRIRGTGFFLQDPRGDGDPATSDGIFVHAPGATGVSPGDGLRARGKVAEFRGLTEVTGAEILPCSKGHTLAPAQLRLPVSRLDELEAAEGMLVTFPQALRIADHLDFDRYGEVLLTSETQYQPTAVADPGPDALRLAARNALGRITLDDGRTTPNPSPAIHPNGAPFGLGNRFRGGDVLTSVTGALDYRFGSYRIQPTTGADYMAVSPRPPAPDAVGGRLRVASMNLMNYFLTIDAGSPVCGPGRDQECRGADNPQELARQRAKVLDALSRIDADIIALLELENTAGVEPAVDLVAGLNAMSGAGPYHHVDTGVVGSDVIRVGILYKPDKVTPAGGFAVLDSSVDRRFLDQYNRPVLAQTFDATAGGGRLTVAVAHLKSKGSPCEAVGDRDPGDGQGNCSRTRAHAAAALADWLTSDPTGSPSAGALILGDLNAYAGEDPLVLLEARGFTDLIALHQGRRAYTFVFEGQRGYLDHALASRALAGAVTGTAVWHINADEPRILDYNTTRKGNAADRLYEPNAFRSSDHDPVIVGLDLCAVRACAAGAGGAVQAGAADGEPQVEKGAGLNH